MTDFTKTFQLIIVTIGLQSPSHNKIDLHCIASLKSHRIRSWYSVWPFVPLVLYVHVICKLLWEIFHVAKKFLASQGFFLVVSGLFEGKHELLPRPNLLDSSALRKRIATEKQATTNSFLNWRKRMLRKSHLSKLPHCCSSTIVELHIQTRKSPTTTQNDFPSSKG